jgi:hypothetical protein
MIKYEIIIKIITSSSLNSSSHQKIIHIKSKLKSQKLIINQIKQNWIIFLKIQFYSHYFDVYLLIIDLHSLRIMFDMSMICMRYLICICNWFKCRSMKMTCVSTFRIEIEMIRNDSKMLRKQRFCITASFLIILDFLFLSMC